VRGTAAVLSIGDQVKELSGGARKQLGSFVNEAKEEKERLPEISEMIKETGDSMKESVNHMAGKMKKTVQATSAFDMESAEELVDDHTKIDNSKKSGMKKARRKPSAPIQNNYQQVHNVLSDEDIRQRLTNLDQ
jgi:CHASE3 domain sensor protein